MINRTYNKFKLFRTYIGGSKKKELQTFLATRDGTNNGSESDWFEFRRLVIIQFEDILHVTCSRKIFAQKLSYILLFLGMILLSFKILSLFCVGIAILLFCLSKYYKNKEHRNICDYNIVMIFTDNYIHQEFGLNLPSIN